MKSYSNNILFTSLIFKIIFKTAPSGVRNTFPRLLINRISGLLTYRIPEIELQRINE